MNQTIATFEPLPWQVEPWQSKAPTLLLGGASGGGKSRIAAEKVHGFMLHYPGSTGLILRKTRESLKNTVVLFLRNQIIGNDPRVHYLKSESRFQYWNDSAIILGGMKDESQREQIRGIGADAGVDIAWMEEGIQFSEDDLNEVMARMRGKAADWSQVIVSTNPGPPNHWIRRRLILEKEAHVVESRPEDNTYNPPQYLETLQKLTGVLGQRLWGGLWVQSEHLVYPEFGLGNLITSEYDPEYPIELGIDEGYIEPRIVLFIQRKSDAIYVFDSIQHKKKLPETTVMEVLKRCASYVDKEDDIPEELSRRGTVEELSAWCSEKEIPLPQMGVGPPDAKVLIRYFRKADIPFRTTSHKIVEGIKIVREQICDENDYHILRVHPTKCKFFVAELTEGYQYPPEDTRKDAEKPLDGNDHGCDAFRYWAFLRAK